MDFAGHGAFEGHGAFDLKNLVAFARLKQTQHQKVGETGKDHGLPSLPFISNHFKQPYVQDPFIFKNQIQDMISENNRFGPTKQTAITMGVVSSCIC